MRNALYALARLLGDLAAIAGGSTARRIGRRGAGKATGSIFRGLFG